MTLDWSDVTAVDAAIVDGDPCVRWRLIYGADTVKLRSTLPSWRRRIVARRVRHHDGVLAIPFAWLADPPETLLVTANYYVQRSRTYTSHP
jgi:hypothetical protein